jgi:hypothetical protein
MKKLIFAFAICMFAGLGVITAAAQDSMMKQDTMMKKDTMKNDTMMAKHHTRRRHRITRHHRRHHTMTHKTA